MPTPRTSCRSALPRRPLKPVIHSGSFIGANVPVWDIADKFGDTNLLVTNMEQGRDLAKCLANNNVALMRGHGFASAGRSLIEVVRMSVYLPRNARAAARKQLGGEIKYLSQARSPRATAGYSPYSPETWRAWEYWANKAGCGHLLTKPEAAHTHRSKPSSRQEIEGASHEYDARTASRAFCPGAGRGGRRRDASRRSGQGR